MTPRSPKNIVASIHQRLLNVSVQSSRTFNDLVMYYAIERFLFRLALSAYADRVVLKGGLLLHVWNAPITRVTRDIDLLGTLSNDLDQIRDMVRNLCTVVVEDDGLFFDPETVKTDRIAEDADYEGVRAIFKGCFGKMRLAMQIDIGFSDVVTPAPIPITYPSVLDHPPAQLLAYNRETVVAEKFEAMIKLGELNSRMKDFFDIWVLSRNYVFDGTLLSDAIRSTLTQRQTDIEGEPVCLTAQFANTGIKATQWKGFIKSSRVEGAPMEFTTVVADVRGFLLPIAKALSDDTSFSQTWTAGGPWRSL